MIPYYIMYGIMILTGIFATKLNVSFKFLKKEKNGVEYISELIYGDEIKKRSRNFVICVVCFLLIYAILALRHPSMGIDLGYYRNWGYLRSFELINEYSWEQVLQMKRFLNYERGYIIFNKVIGSIFLNRQFFMAMCALPAILPIAVFIYKYSKSPLISFMIYLGMPVFLVCFSGLRQAIAIGIVISGFKFVEEKKPIKYIITLFIASLFHRTACVCIIMYLLYHIKMTRKWKVISVASLPVIFLLSEPLFMIAAKLIINDPNIENTGAGMLFLVFTAIYIFMLIFSDKDDKQLTGFINVFYFACVCQAFSGVYNIAVRLGYYFMIFLAPALANTVLNLKKIKNIKVLFYAAYIGIFVAFLLFGIVSLENKESWAITNPYNLFITDISSN